MRPDMNIYIVILLVVLVGIYLVWKKSLSSASYIQLNNQRIPLSEIKRFSADNITDLVENIFQAKGYRVQSTSGELQNIADFLLEKEGDRGFVSTRYWGETKVGVAQISQDVIGMNQQNTNHNYIITTGTFDKEVAEMAKYNRNLFLIDGRKLNVMIAAAKQSE